MDFDKQRNEYILNYLENDKTNTALLLKGGWGIGKSYYIKHSLIPFLETRNKQTVSASLYGIKNAEELSKFIFTESRFKSLNSKKGIVGVGIAKTVIRGVSGFFNIDLSGGNDEWEQLKKYANLKNKLLIIDDLERHDPAFSIVEILGYVNNLCENDGVKVLLICDENKILEAMGETNESQTYKTIKEKTISDTLDFIPNYDYALKEILDEFKFEFLHKNEFDSFVKKIREVSETKGINSYNLRSFSRACQKMMDMVNGYRDVFQNILSQRNGREFIESVFLGLIAFYFRLSRDTTLTFDKESTISSTDLGTFRYPFYKFAYDFCKIQIMDPEDVRKALELFDYSMLSGEAKAVVDKIHSYYRVSAEELKITLSQFEELIKKDGVNIQSYTGIATYLIAIEYQTGIETKHLLDLMVSNIKAHKITNEQADELKEIVYGCSFETKDEAVAFNSFIEEISKCVEGELEIRQEKLNRGNLSIVLDKAYKNKDKWLASKKGFSYYFDFGMVSEFIGKTETTAAEVDEIRGLFISFYQRIANIYDFCKPDIEPLKKFKQEIDLIKDDDSNDEIKKLQLRWLSETIESSINKLSNGRSK